MKRILVVDDSAANRYLLEATLQAYGYEVTSVTDGAEALSCARRQPPDLVISDILMPVMDGFALCKEWRADPTLRGIPFIFYSATYTDARDEQLAMDLGANRFVIKPQEPQVMHEIIEEVLARGTKSLAAAVVLSPPADETVTLREYNAVLVRKLEKKVAELESAREALQRSDERWRLIYEAEPECVKVVSAELKLEAMNPAGLRMIDADSLEQVLGHSLMDVIIPEHRDAYLDMHQKVIAGQPGRVVFEIVGLKGSRIWLETQAVPLRNADGSVSQLGITRDITRQRQSEALVNGQKQVLELIASGVPLVESLAALLRVVEEQTTDMLGSILLLDADGLHLRHAAAPSLAPEYCSAIDGVAIGPCVGSCGTAAYRREPVIVEDIASDPLWAEYQDLALRHGLRACWSTPIFDVTRRVLGTFAMYYRRPGRPNEHQLRLIEMATHTAAIAISKHQEEMARLAAQAALRESEARYRILADNTDDFVSLHDAQGNRLYVSPSYFRVTGWTFEDLQRTDWRTRLHPEDLPMIERTRAANLAGEPTLIEHRIRCKDGSWIWVELRCKSLPGPDGRVAQLLNWSRDITARKQAETALIESEQRFRRLFESARDAIFVEDFAGNVRDVNLAACRLHGLTREQLLKKNVRDLVPQDQSENIDRDFARLLRGESTLVEGFSRRADGTAVPVEISVSRFVYSGQPSLLLHVRDITERQRAANELAASRERLVKLSRQLIAAQESERRHLARELHDEIGQILTAVSMSLQQVKSLVPASELGRIDNSVGIVSQAIQAVRDLSLNLRPSMLDDFGLVATVRWYLERQQSLTDCELKLEADSFKVALPAEINTACYRVVQEAINNILRHARAQHAWVHIDLVEGEVQITIRDDGIGFHPIEAGQSSTQEDRLGILGMQERVQLIGGQFAIDSIPSQGTTVRARFVLAADNQVDCDSPLANGE